ncbi:hypothetical protein GJ744_008208 [Endocarpon pusillum]|uniref:RNA helicase n=1 Tax=Endocarpon pusillum TaxID=364733 RepID=A0A8H7AKZ7_9EURO|nr:hypothetical protein GJ744_008208 [Endocarpon pusillum]
MADTFATGEMQGALDDVSNDVTAKNADATTAAREKGWAEPSSYDYEEYGKEPKDATGVDSTMPAWGHNAQKYEWKEEYGEVGPRNEELEKMLYHSEFITRQGIKFDELRSIKVTTETTQTDRPDPISDFHSAGLHPVMVQNIEHCGYKDPTPVQAYTIPAAVQNRDIIAVAQTGSGKTAAYLIPTISKLMGKVKKLAGRRPNLANGYNPAVDAVRAEPLILVVAPTRELCTQIFDEARRLCYRSMLRPCVAYGGAPKLEQRDELQRGCDVLIATPGRLLDFMSEPHVLTLGRVRYTIIDEADEMISPDWEGDIGRIMSGGDTNEDSDHHYLLFSATFKPELRKVAKKYLANDHIRIRIGRAGSTHMNVKQIIVWIERNMKQKAVYDLLLSMPPSRTLIFVATKKNADFLDDYLYNLGMPSTSIHSDRTQREREDALRAFRTGKCPILIATAVTARGLDIRNVMHVINYDLPSVDHGGIDEYVHRIGRTARIGNEGLATSFYNDRDEPLAEDLVKVLLESNQEVPDFLADKKPEDGEELKFDDDSEEEEVGIDGDDANGAAADWGPGGGDAWGGDNAAAPAAVAPAVPAPADEWNAEGAQAW